METRKDLAGENLFCSSTWLQLLHLTLCRSLPVDRAFRLTVLLASMSRPVIDLTIDLTKADGPSDSDYPRAMVDRGSSSDSCIVISDDGMR